jgi:hypothetical protein
MMRKGVQEFEEFKEFWRDPLCRSAVLWAGSKRLPGRAADCPC